jgi:hypothetical protein
MTATDVAEKAEDQTEAKGGELIRLKLSEVEEKALARCEEAIEKFNGTASKAGKAIHEIKEAKLYREHFETFEDYCQKRWGFTPMWANTLVKRHLAFHGIKENEKIEYKPAPDSPAINVIAQIKDPDKQQKLWDKVVKKSEEDGSLETVDEEKKIVEPDIGIVREAVNRSQAAEKSGAAKAHSGSKAGKAESNGHASPAKAFKDFDKAIGAVIRMADTIKRQVGGVREHRKLLAACNLVRKQAERWKESVKNRD